MTLFPRIDTSVQPLQRISIVKATNRNSLEANSALRYGASSSAYHGDHALSWRYTLAVEGSPPITRTAFPTCRAHYPADRAGARVDCFPAHTTSPKGRRADIRGPLRLHSQLTATSGPSLRALVSERCSMLPFGISPSRTPLFVTEKSKPPSSSAA